MTGLEPLAPTLCRPLAQSLAAMDPWARLSYSADTLDRYLARPDPALDRQVIVVDGAMAAVVALRSPWLRGPYVELLAVLPGFQGRGLGRIAMDWCVAKAQGAANLWVCVSDFNVAAQAFYHRLGFVQEARLDGLAAPGMAELLLRKMLG